MALGLRPWTMDLEPLTDSQDGPWLSFVRSEAAENQAFRFSSLIIR